jgi:hypothetical protein
MKVIVRDAPAKDDPARGADTLFYFSSRNISETRLPTYYKQLWNANVRLTLRPRSRRMLDFF